jgi:hypothetical protein
LTRRTLPNHRWTTGQVERMNRTIKDATAKRYPYDSHEQPRSRLADFLDAYNFARRLKTLSGLTPHEYACKTWTSEPDRFITDPRRKVPGLNTWIHRDERSVGWPRVGQGAAGPFAHSA